MITRILMTSGSLYMWPGDMRVGHSGKDKDWDGCFTARSPNQTGGLQKIISLLGLRGSYV